MIDKKIIKFLVACTIFVVVISFILPVILIKVCGIDFQNYGSYGGFFGCFSALTSALAFGGLIYTIILMKNQLNESIKIKQADYLHGFVEKIAYDSDVVEFVNLIDYKLVDWYNKDFHKGSKYERVADKTLLYLSYELYLKKEGAISDGEFHFMKYYLKRILNDRQTQDYLYNLFHFDKEEFLYKNLVEYADEQGWISPDFYDKKSWENGRFHRYLNF